MARKKPDKFPGAVQAIGEPAEVTHPDWCDEALCTVTPAADLLKEHRGRPVTFAVEHGTPRKLTVTASLFQPARYPLAGPYVDLEVAGLDNDHLETTARAQVPAEEAARLGSMLLDLAAAAGAAAGPSASGTPRAVLREFDDLIDVVGSGGRVQLTFAEARDIEDQVSAILAIFDPERLANSEVMNDILTREYLDRQPGQTAGGGQ